jgi:hypothetical protein
MAEQITADAKTVIFLHIPKTAGSTLLRIIEKQYHPDEICSLYLRRDFRAFDRLTEARKAQIRIYRGHIIFGWAQRLPQPATRFTILRNPVERAISNYYFTREYAEHHHHDLVHSQNLSLADYLDSKEELMADNGQTRMLSGGYYVMDYGGLSREALEAAKANLRDNIQVVGLTERFDETLLLLKNAFGWGNVFYARQNVGRQRPTKDQLSPDTLAVIHKYNQLDIELYQFAKTLFAEQVRKQGSSFAQEVRSFQRANRLLSWPIRVQWLIQGTSLRSLLKPWMPPSLCLS